MLKFPVVQLAYFVGDVRRGAREMAERFGAGPFFVAEKIPLAWCEHRGRPGGFVHTSAYGQWGGLMVEFVQQDEEGASPFRDMYAPGQEGLHHVAMMVDSLADTYAYCSDARLEIASKAQTTSGVEFAFVDTVKPLGHMIEIYARGEQLTGFYEFVRNASLGWDGRDPVRTLGSSGR